MTEDEAKTKWCPFARTLGTLRQPANPGSADYIVGQGGQNRGYAMGGALDSCLCIASACMAWRWAGYRAESGAWVRKTAAGPWDAAKADGYCGLAGAVQ